MNEIKRTPEVSYYSKVNGKANCSIEDCIDFTIQNIGGTLVYYGFQRDSDPDIPLVPNAYSPFPLYRACEVWSGEIWIKFGPEGGKVMVVKTL